MVGGKEGYRAEEDKRFDKWIIRILTAAFLVASIVGAIKSCRELSTYKASKVTND